MDYKRRYEKLRRFVGKINEERKIQGQKIDILCNDLIVTQKEFIKKLDTISFAADFYGQLLGLADLDRLLYATDKLIKDEAGDINVGFFLYEGKSFTLQMFESQYGFTKEEDRLERCFAEEVVDNIRKANKRCCLDELMKMGLAVNPAVVKKSWAVTIPLERLGQSTGFVLLYHRREEKPSSEAVNNICSITVGLTQALVTCQQLARTAN